MSDSGIGVTVVDDKTGDVETQRIALDDYVIVVTGRRYVAGIQQYANGTVVITTKLDKADS